MLRYPKTCIVCQTWILFKVPLCRLCRRYLYKEFQKNIDFVSDLSDEFEDRICVSLWHWDQNNHYTIQDTIVALKDGANEKLYYLLASWMEKKLRHHDMDIHKTLVAIPSQRKHPEKLLEVFSKVFASRSLNLLEKSKKNFVQKSLSKYQRETVRFKKKQVSLNCPRLGPIILLDDVLVTGSSAKQAILTLEPYQVEYIVVWAERF